MRAFRLRRCFFFISRQQIEAYSPSPVSLKAEYILVSCFALSADGAGAIVHFFAQPFLEGTRGTFDSNFVGVFSRDCHFRRKSRLVGVLAQRRRLLARTSSSYRRLMRHWTVLPPTQRTSHRVLWLVALLRVRFFGERQMSMECEYAPRFSAGASLRGLDGHGSTPQRDS